MNKLALAFITIIIISSCEKPEVTLVPGDVIVYPNPVTSEFFIDITNPGTEPYELKVYDVEGVLIKQENINQGAKTIQINVGNSPAGKFNIVVKRPKDGISKIEVLKL